MKYILRCTPDGVLGYGGMQKTGIVTFVPNVLIPAYYKDSHPNGCGNKNKL